MRTSALSLVVAVAVALAGMSADAAPKKTTSSKRSSTSGKSSQSAAEGTLRITTKTFAPKRTTPVFKGEFVVDLVVIAFPDCETPNIADVPKLLSSVRGSTIQDYYKEYSWGVTWPVLRAYSQVYMAPHPLGYYCRHDYFANRIGFGGDGGARAAKLRADALAAVKRSRYLEGSPAGKTAVTCYVYCRNLNRDKVEKLLRGAYPKTPIKDEIGMYNPPIPWSDPLWPNSIPQVHFPSDGGTIVHELGHVLGAPDFYHATEEHDGMPGTPSLPWAFGPTGLAYCRAIYQAFVPIKNYPTITKSGTVELLPRASKGPLEGNIGCFVPSAHPNYMFYIEYVKNEHAPIGSEGDEGILIHVINVTFGSPMMGPPDLCYTYRPDDPYFRALGGHKGSAYFRDGMEFDEKSNPAAMLPNLIPAGIAIRNIKLGEKSATFDLEIASTSISQKDAVEALKPKVAITAVDEVLPTSLRAHMDVRYRGEPLLVEYGFCYDTSPYPTVSRKCFPLYHRDRYDARILGLTPSRTYYIRAYAKNPNGVVSYSDKQAKVVMPPAKMPDKVPPLLTDNIRGNFYFNTWYYGDRDGVHVTSNPLLSFMSLATYYRALPNAGRGRSPINMTRVHTHPTRSRPKFRLAEVDALHGAMKGLVNSLGFGKREFDPKWEKTFCAGLGIRKPKETVFEVTKETIHNHERRIRQWLALGYPVMVVRENSIVPPDTGIYYPLDIAIIHGYDDEETYCLSFPQGKDRGLRRDGSYSLDVLFEHVVSARLVFYAPIPLPPVQLTETKGR